MKETVTSLTNDVTNHNVTSVHFKMMMLPFLSVNSESEP